MLGGCTALQDVGILYRGSVGIGCVLGKVLKHPVKVFDVVSLGCDE